MHTKNNIIILATVTVLILLLLAACQSPSTQTEEKMDTPQTTQEPEPVLEPEIINETLIISGIDGGECVVAQIRLWRSTDTRYSTGSISQACSGVKVTATKRLDLTDSKGRVFYYIIGPDGNEGWITDSFINPAGICETREDCQGLGAYYGTRENYLGELVDYYESVNPTCLEGICVECVTNRDCPSSSTYGEDRKQICDTQTHSCVECLSNNDCPSDSLYDERQTCDLASKKCAECLADSDCPASDSSFDKNKRFCDIDSFSPEYNECIECRNNYDCAESEYCDTSLNWCQTRS